MWWVLFSILIQTGIWSKPEVIKTNPANPKVISVLQPGNTGAGSRAALAGLVREHPIFH